MLQVAECHDSSAAHVNPPKRPSIRERRQKLLTFLQGIALLLHIFNIGCDGSFSHICHSYILKAAPMNELISFILPLWQKNMSLFMQGGLQNDVLYVDGLKIGTTTKLLYATGLSIQMILYLSR